LVTSDYVFDEAVTRVARMAGHRAAVRLGEGLRGSAVARVVRLEPSDLERAWELFVKFDDQRLSFTDCTTVALAERLKPRAVFAFDDDFGKVGLKVVP
jgi:hypothetical protein